jgi:antitoxin CptB
MTMAASRLDPRTLGRLKWRCRRGLLENDLLIERFFRRHEETITLSQATGLETLMDLADNDLLDLLLARKEPAGVAQEIDCPEVHEVLALMRPASASRPGAPVAPPVERPSS